MKRKHTSMLSPERISLLLLAIVLAVWALTATLSQCSRNSAAPMPKAVVDTIVVSNTSNSPDSVKSKSRTSKSKRASEKKGKKERKKKEKAPVRHRDHLREPISD